MLTLTRASVKPIRSARFLLKSVLGLGNFENSSSSCVTCSWVRRGRVDVSTSSALSVGNPDVPEVERWCAAVGPSNEGGFG